MLSAADAEGKLAEQGWRKEQKWALDMGLPGAECLTDRSIPTFSRGELPHFAGINVVRYELTKIGGGPVNKEPALACYVTASCGSEK